MTSTSFNPIQPQQQAVHANQPLTLREGLVFQGTIKKLYPDQMAEIQVGGHKLIAKLEVPLAAGDSHFFQVARTGTQTELKVVTGPMGQAANPQQQMAQLLQSMNLPQTKEMQQAMSHFMKAQLPITRDQLLQAETWLKALPQGTTKQEALGAMQRMIDLRMPFTNEVFQALVHGAKTEGMSTALHNFMSRLANEANVDGTLKASLTTQLQTIAKPLDAETGGVLLAQAVRSLSDSNAPVASRIHSLSLLQEAAIVRRGATLSNWRTPLNVDVLPSAQVGQLIGRMLSAGPEASGQAIQQVRAYLQAEALLTADQKGQLLQMIDRFTKLPQTKQTLEVFAHQLQDRLLKAFSANNESRLFMQHDRTHSLPLLQEAAIVRRGATLSNWRTPLNADVLPSAQVGQLIGRMLAAGPETSGQAIQQVRAYLQAEALLTADQKGQLLQMIDRFMKLPQTKQTLEVFAHQLQDRLLKAFSANNDSRMFMQNDSGLTARDQILSLLKPDAAMASNDALMKGLVRASAESVQPAHQVMLTEAEALVRNAIDGKAMEQAVKTVLKGLGIGYEAALNSKAVDMSALAQSVKPQLLTLLQDTQISPPLRESAEVLMARLNGMQLMSGENGHQHQLVMQIPLEFCGRRMDATLQWNGRMGKDGKIDANFARVLFYLDMASLQETVIDMQVQNRIITITIFNEDPRLDMLAGPLKQSLRAGLGEKEYQLSGLFVKQFEKTTLENVTENSKKDAGKWNGVDIRV